MEINIDATAIQEAVVRAITDSAIGESIKKVISDELDKKASYWDSDTIIGRAIKDEVQRVILIIVRDEIDANKEKIRQVVAPELTDEVLRRMGCAAIEAMLGNLRPE